MNYIDYSIMIKDAIDRIVNEEKENILNASKIIESALKNKGKIYIFGCGHSGILSMEAFYRAGGLCSIQPIFIEPIMLHLSASESSHLEKRSGYMDTFKNNYKFNLNDILITASTSDKNAVPVEYTSYVSSLGIKTIGIYSKEYENSTVNNNINKHLHEVVDVSIDNKAPYGDACLSLDGLNTNITPISTITGVFILNSILSEGARLALLDGAKVDAFISGNIEGGNEFNKELIEKYKKDIKHL